MFTYGNCSAVRLTGCRRKYIDGFEWDSASGAGCRNRVVFFCFGDGGKVWLRCRFDGFLDFMFWRFLYVYNKREV